MSSNGLTTFVNETGSGDVLRKAAAIAEVAIKKSARFNTASVNDLAAWASDYLYESQDEKHKQMVKECFDFSAIRKANYKSVAHAIRESTDLPDSSKPGQAFEQLDESGKNIWTRKLAELHGLIGYSLWTVLIPFYVRERTKLGTRGKHWRSLEISSPIRANRADVFNLVKSLKASDHITAAPADVSLLDYFDWSFDADDERLRYLLERDFSVEGENAETGGTSTHTLRGIASTFVRVMWIALVVLGREPHPISAIRPLAANEWCVIVNGHGVPEDLLIGTRITPPIKYGDLAQGTTGFTPCKEWSFLTSITNDAFYSDIFLPQVFFSVRARALALACKEPNIDRQFLCREIYYASSDTTTTSFNNNLAAVFGALKRGGADKYTPDAMDVAAIRAFGVDTASLDASGLALTYSVHKYLNAFNQDFLAARRHMRANVTIGRALDRGGLKSKQSAGRLPSVEDDGLREMVRALLTRIWQPTWVSVIQPWLRQLSLPTDSSSFLLTHETGSLALFADSKGFTRGDAERVQLLLMLHLSVFRSQVWRDAVVEEFELVRRDGQVFYTFSLSRVFKTATAQTGDNMPQLTSWQLSETESMLVHAALLLCRPLVSTGTKRTQRMFLDASGTPVTQRWIEARFAEIGKHWLGVPRLGPHSLRTMWLSWLVNSGLISEQDFDNLAAYVQVSRCVMLESYATPSHNGPAQRVGQLLRDGGHAAASADPNASIAAFVSSDADQMSVAGKTKKLYGKAISKVRNGYKAQALAVVEAHGGDTKAAFEALVSKRKLESLGEDEQFFHKDVTDIEDGNFKAWKKLCAEA
ncbi:hypothetical protein JKP88DRAFT_314223 [Tribonema minus]|uniref:Uncharacterized protein n=1 Tax=Tribonema minus TaxID=303371 RepID=A0A835Z056_9STRA|nr:hypothetical protein JKP88DRAFT_314223 [Tribonema minus]